MGCSCFSDTVESCDHQRANDTLVIDLGDDSQKELTIEIDDTVTALRHMTQSERTASPSEYYNHMHRRFAEQNQLWEQLRQLHRTFRPRPLGLRQVMDFGDGVPNELRYLIY